MYTNIDTNHGLSTISTFIQINLHLLPPEYPMKLILHLLTLVMKKHVFKFGDLWFLQKKGTAMGTIVAVKYSIIYFALHEQLTILSKYQHQFLYFRCFIDDIFVIWNPNGIYSHKDLKKDIYTYLQKVRTHLVHLKVTNN